MSEQEESVTNASQAAPLTDEEKQARIREALARLEVEHENNTAATPRLSKQFWYAAHNIGYFDINPISPPAVYNAAHRHTLVSF